MLDSYDRWRCGSNGEESSTAWRIPCNATIKLAGLLLVVISNTFFSKTFKLIVFCHNNMLLSLCFFLLLFSCVLRFPESENEIFWDWSVCICISVCYQHFPKTNFSRNSKFRMLHSFTSYRCYLKFLWRLDKQSMNKTKAHKRILIRYGLWGGFLVSVF